MAIAVNTNIGLMLGVEGAGPALTQFSFDVSCFLGVQSAKAVLYNVLSHTVYYQIFCTSRLSPKCEDTLSAAAGDRGWN